MGPVGKGRRKRTGPVLLGETSKCECICHIPEEDRPKPKKKATRRKK